jgi:hypothetical protein
MFSAHFSRHYKLFVEHWSVISEEGANWITLALTVGIGDD